MQIQTSLKLFKEDFRFSAAHFLIFDETHAEQLHGHNFVVRVELGLPPRSSFNQRGLHQPFNHYKIWLRSQFQKLNETIILPALHPDIQVIDETNSPELSSQSSSSSPEILKKSSVGRSATCLKILFRDRQYVFPKNEVQLLPISNSSVEELSYYFASQMWHEFKNDHLQFVSIEIQEVPGQSALTRVQE